jgi:hypothetical protein
MTSDCRNWNLAYFDSKGQVFLKDMYNFIWLKDLYPINFKVTPQMLSDSTRPIIKGSIQISNHEKEMRKGNAVLHTKNNH